MNTERLVSLAFAAIILLIVVWFLVHLLARG